MKNKTLDYVVKCIAMPIGGIAIGTFISGIIKLIL